MQWQFQETELELRLGFQAAEREVLWVVAALLNQLLYVTQEKAKCGPEFFV